MITSVKYAFINLNCINHTNNTRIGIHTCIKSVITVSPSLYLQTATTGRPIITWESSSQVAFRNRVIKDNVKAHRKPLSTLAIESIVDGISYVVQATFTAHTYTIVSCQLMKDLINL